MIGKCFGMSCIALACATVQAANVADTYPSKPVRVIVPYAAGGSDLYVRPLQEKLQEILGQPMVIENIGGGGGTVGSARVARAKPDGYTVLFAATGAIITAPKLTEASYTWRDFSPVANLIAIPFTWVTRSDSNMRDFKDLVARAKAQPGKVNYASPGHGTSTQMIADATAIAAGISITEIPYQGGAPAVAAVLGGHVDVMLGAPSNVMPQVNAGALRALAVTGGKRFVPTPDVPTQREQGVDVALTANYGFFVPRGTPQAVVDKLAAAIRTAAADPKYVETMRSGFVDVAFMGPAEQAASLQEEDRIFTKIMREMGLIAK